MQTTTTARHPAAQAALVAKHAEAHELLADLAAKIDGIDPETAHWGHVGDLSHYVAVLRDLVSPS